MHGVDPDGVRRQLQGQRAHQADDPVLGGHVVRQVGNGLQARRRAGQHDRPARALLDQVRDRRLGRVPDPGQVGVDHVLPGSLIQLGSQPVGRDAGVGRHDVQPAQLGHAVVQSRLQRGIIADVGLGRHDPPVQRLDLLDRLGQVLRRRHRVRYRLHLAAQVDRDDVGTLLGQPDRVAASLAARRSGDEGDFAFHSSRHREFLTSCS